MYLINTKHDYLGLLLGKFLQLSASDRNLAVTDTEHNNK